jgi:hypothetical protein
MYLIHCIRLIIISLTESTLVPEQGVAQEIIQEPAPEPAIEDLPAPALEGKPRFYA